eukprot:gb/GFBE01040115.1/.p1 GENE.gb/GFBE01040115.1/~~gb/GFBE01040115.1/.p1  ORF type:complete len:272 (+),score=35.02 gb/GFBE01040115.1/:1-816(+)
MPIARPRRSRALASRKVMQKVLRRPSHRPAPRSKVTAAAPQGPATTPGLVGCLRRGSACQHSAGGPVPTPSGKRRSPLRRASRASSPACKVQFKDMVEVCEFSRLLGGGGGVPSDTFPALGIGERMRTVHEQLASERPGTGKMDQDVPSVPPRKRCMLLREAMGKAAFQKAQREHRQEIGQLQFSRDASNETEEDFLPMPISLAQARRMAEKLHREVKPASSPCPDKSPAGQAARSKAVLRRPASAKAVMKRKRAAPTADRGSKRKAARRK